MEKIEKRGKFSFRSRIPYVPLPCQIYGAQPLFKIRKIYFFARTNKYF